MVKKLAIVPILTWGLAALFLCLFDKNLFVQAASRTATLGATITPLPVGTWVVYPNSPTTNNLRSVSLASANEGWAVGDGGVLLHYLNGTWSDATPTNVGDYPQLTWYSISMAGASAGWIVGEYYDSSIHEMRGLLAQYDGITWTMHIGEEVTSNQVPMKPLRSIYMASATEGFTVGLNAEIGHFVDGSWHKEVRDGPNFYTVGGADAQWVWLGGDEGKQFYRDASGDWQGAGVWTVATVNSTSFADRDYGWFTTDGPGVLLYDASVNACPLDCKTQNHVVNGLVGVQLRSVKLVNRLEGWMVGTQGVILHGPNDDPYDKWTVVRQASQDAPTLNSVDMASSREGWIVGDQGVLLRYSLPPEPTATVTISPTPTNTVTPMPTVTATGTPTPTITRTATRTATQTATATLNSTATQTGTPSATETVTATRTVTASPSATATQTATTTPATTATAIPQTATETPTASLTPSVTATLTATPSVTATPTAMIQPTARLFLPLLFREGRIIR
ncbi:MAG: hypothetical protein EXR62_02210 [Chloroflexi bacterium]|nr:hypothetical protein [Chloroflexota bacterium]